MRIRTINKAYEEIKAKDPDTCLTLYKVRQLVTSGAVPSTKAGWKWLVDVGTLERYIERMTEGVN